MCGWTLISDAMAANPRYFALTVRTGGPSGGSLLHLVREDTEASLCGLPRTTLGQGGMFDQVVCPDCIEWLHKRKLVSGRFPKVPAT
jgi:hypothetical protein